MLYHERCGIYFGESGLSVCRDVEKDTRGERPGRYSPQQSGSLANHIGGNAVLLRTDTYIIVTSSFGMDTALTSAAIWRAGQDVPTIVHGCGDMEEHCQKALVVVICKVARNGYGSGGHTRGAFFHHSLQTPLIAN